MKVIALLFFYQFVLLANASQLYNFNRTGLALREKVQDSKILLIIPYGEKVEFIEHCKVFETVEGVHGEWFKIKFNQKIGFAFGGYLLPIPAPEINSTMGNYMKKNYKFESHEESYNSTYFIEYHTYYYSFQNKKFIYNTEKSPEHFTESLELPFSTASLAYLLGRALYKAYYEESKTAIRKCLIKKKSEVCEQFYIPQDIDTIPYHQYKIKKSGNYWVQFYTSMNTHNIENLRIQILNKSTFLSRESGN